MTSNDDPVAGIDVSQYQEAIDWRKVAAEGCSFAFIKATEGASRQDPNFATNWAEAKRAGIRCGAYHFFRPLSPVDDQVTNFLSVVTALGNEDLPPVLDLEVPDDWSTINLSKRVPLVLRWLGQVQEGLKKRPIIYLSPSFIGDVLANTILLSSYPLWLAHYTASPAPTVPRAWGDWTFWQYTNTGYVNGVGGQVDLNWFNGDTVTFRKFISASNSASS